MKRKSNARVFPVFFLGSIVSVLLIGAALCALGWFVKNNDLRGGVLLIFMLTAMLPGCMFFPVFIQRKLRWKGLICGLICGGVLSVLYFLFIAVTLRFRFQPFLWLLLPAGIAAGVCSGIFSANFFRR